MPKISALLGVLFPLLIAPGSSVQTIDISGTWNAQTTSVLGTARQSITFKQASDRFTGQMITSEGKRELITDGKITGDQVQFNVMRQRADGQTVLVLYRGKITGKQMAGTFVGWSGRTVNWIATHR